MTAPATRVACRFFGRSTLVEFQVTKSWRYELGHTASHPNCHSFLTFLLHLSFAVSNLGRCGFDREATIGSASELFLVITTVCGSVSGGRANPGAVLHGGAGAHLGAATTAQARVPSRDAGATGDLGRSLGDGPLRFWSRFSCFFLNIYRFSWTFHGFSRFFSMIFVGSWISDPSFLVGCSLTPHRPQPVMKHDASCNT